MVKQKSVEERIEEYLNAVKAHLDAGEIENTGDVLTSIREQIEDELEARRESGELDGDAVEAVFAGLDAPEAYAVFEPMEGDEALGTARPFSKRALWGAGFLPFGIIAAIMFFRVASISSGPAGLVDQGPTVGQVAARYVMLPLGILSPFVSTVLGIMGVREVLNSRGRVSGLGLAFAVAMFYPILVLDAVLFVVSANAFSAADYWNIVLVVTVAVILALDVWLVRKGWHMINKS